MRLLKIAFEDAFDDVNSSNGVQLPDEFNSLFFQITLDEIVEVIVNNTFPKRMLRQAVKYQDPSKTIDGFVFKLYEENMISELHSMPGDWGVISFRHPKVSFPKYPVFPIRTNMGQTSHIYEYIDTPPISFDRILIKSDPENFKTTPKGIEFVYLPPRISFNDAMLKKLISVCGVEYIDYIWA